MTDRIGDLAAQDSYDPFAAEQFVNPVVQSTMGALLAPRVRDENSPVEYTTASPLVNITSQDIADATDKAMAFSGGGLGIKAYHGSPHDFSAFDLSKIGTGEGAQAYGHGLYFADSEGVARSYRDALAPGQTLLLNGTKASSLPTSEGYVVNAMHNWGQTPQQIAEKFDALSAKELEKAKADGGWDVAKEMGVDPSDLYGTNHRNIANAARRIANGPAEITVGPKGHMYEVNINADPAHFLDWDKPLKDQQEIVKKLYGKLPEQEYATNYAKAVHDMGGDADAAHSAIIDLTHNPGAASNDASWKVLTEGPQPKGFDINDIHDKLRPTYFDRFDGTYHPRTGRDVEGGVRDPQAVQELAAKGIPGIKYLDQGSRGPSPYNIIPRPRGDFIFKEKLYPDLASAQEAKKAADIAYDAERSSNYVVFNDKLIDILRKYGIAGLPAGAAGMGALAGQDNYQP